MGKGTFVFVSLALLAGVAAADHPDLSGTWVRDSDHSQTLSIVQKEDKVQMKDGTLEVECNTLGKECKAGDAKVSFYFNGPKLVMLETRKGGDIVVKRRLEAGADGKTLTMEVMPLVPAGKDESFTYTRQ